MGIPNKFKHKGKSWKVRFEENLAHEDGTKCDGICDTATRTISIDKDLTDAEKFSAYLHETFHVMVHEAHIGENIRFTEEVEDILAEAFTDLMLSTFKIKWKSNK